MDEIKKYIEKINSLTFRGQRKYVKTKLLSFKTSDIPYTTFFKKLCILLYNLPWHLKETNIEIGLRKELLINFWNSLEADKCFYDGMCYIQLECVKLPDFTYLIGIPVRSRIIIYIYILIDDKHNDERKN